MSKKDKQTAGQPYQTVSMTGFGKGICEEAGVRIEVELKAVNSRFLDINYKLPRSLAELENSVKNVLSEKISRGRIEVFVKRTPLIDSLRSVEFQDSLFEAYLKVFEQVAKQLDIYDAEMKKSILIDLLGRREILDVGEEIENLETEREALLKAVVKARDNLCEMRLNEGKKIGVDINSHIEALHKIHNRVKEKAPLAPELLKEKLLERIRNLTSEITLDESRFTAEVAYLADRVDITEELIRLESHFQQFVSILAVSPNGRKLEFLLQEFGREFNTIGSKAQDAEIQSLVVEAKSEIEKIKEQIMNLE